MSINFKFEIGQRAANFLENSEPENNRAKWSSYCKGRCWGILKGVTGIVTSITAMAVRVFYNNSFSPFVKQSLSLLSGVSGQCAVQWIAPEKMTSLENRLFITYYGWWFLSWAQLWFNSNILSKATKGEIKEDTINEVVDILLITTFGIIMTTIIDKTWKANLGDQVLPSYGDLNCDPSNHEMIRERLASDPSVISIPHSEAIDLKGDDKVITKRIKTLLNTTCSRVTVSLLQVSLALIALEVVTQKSDDKIVEKLLRLAAAFGCGELIEYAIYAFRKWYEKKYSKQEKASCLLKFSRFIEVFAWMTTVIFPGVVAMNTKETDWIGASLVGMGDANRRMVFITKRVDQLGVRTLEKRRNACKTYFCSNKWDVVKWGASVLGWGYIATQFILGTMASRIALVSFSLGTMGNYWFNKFLESRTINHLSSKYLNEIFLRVNFSLPFPLIYLAVSGQLDLSSTEFNQYDVEKMVWTALAYCDLGRTMGGTTRGQLESVLKQGTFPLLSLYLALFLSRID